MAVKVGSSIISVELPLQKVARACHTEAHQILTNKPTIHPHHPYKPHPGAFCTNILHAMGKQVLWAKHVI